MGAKKVAETRLQGSQPPTVFNVWHDGASSDTARASDIAPTSALKIKVAFDLAAHLSLPGSHKGEPKLTESVEIIARSMATSPKRWLGASGKTPKDDQQTTKTSRSQPSLLF